MKFGVLTLAATMFFPVPAQTADVPGTLAAARQQVMTADYRLSGRLARVDASGARTSYGVNIKARWFPGILRVLVEVSSPATARVHVLLEMRPGEK
ncbi:MAG: outer membrane lipoprotein-sorting protein, partial [Silvibacterium sp.]